MIKSVSEFINALEKENPGVEAVILNIGGEEVIEKVFYPLAARNIYSHTKSFTSTAVGIAIDEGKISLDTKLSELFPEYLNLAVSKEITDIKLKHILTMSSGFGKPYLMGADRRAGVGYPDYMAYMFSRPVIDKPGTKFVYSTADSHLAARMVEKAVGKNINAYLYEKLFSKMDIGFPIWETDPQGHPIGGGGLHLSLRDMMKLGILYLNKGMWGNERIVSEEWVNLATTKKIDTGNTDNWGKEYGYQFWMGPNKCAFRADGAHGQLSFVIPSENAVLGIQCSDYNDFPKFQKLLNETVFKD